MDWDNISDGDNRASPTQASGDATLRFDQMLMADSLLLDEHSYDNYLDDLDQQDVSFAVPPFASSTPSAQKTNSRQPEALRSRLVQLRRSAMPALPAQVPLATHTPRARRANAATKDLMPRKGPSDSLVARSAKRMIDISGLPGPEPGKENVYSPQPNTHTPLNLEVKSQPIIEPITVDKPMSTHIPHPQTTSNSPRNAPTGIPGPRPNNQIPSAIGTTHSRTNSASSRILGPSTTTKAMTHRSLSSRLASAFSAFDSITEPANSTTITIVEPIPAVLVTSNSHHNIAIDGPRLSVLTRNEVHSGLLAASTYIPPTSSGLVHSDAGINPQNPMRNMDNAPSYTSITQDEDRHAPHLDPPVQNDQKSVTEWAPQHSNAYPQHSRSPTSKVPPDNFVEEEVPFSAVPFPTPKDEETAAFPGKRIPSSVFSPPSSLSYETRGSFAPASQPLLPGYSSASSLPIPLPKPAKSEDEATDICTDSNDPDEMFAQQLEGMHHSLVRHRLSDGMANPLMSDASSKIKSDPFVALEPESIQAPEPTSVFAISSLAESILNVPPQEMKLTVITNPGVGGSPRVLDTENQDEGKEKEINQDLIKPIGVQKKSSGSSGTSRQAKAATEVPNWVYPVPPRTSTTSTAAPSTLKTVPVIAPVSQPIAPPTSGTHIESDSATSVTKATSSRSHHRVASSSSPSTTLHSKSSESATGTVAQAPKGAISTQAQPITRAQSTASVSKLSVPSSTISSRAQTRTMSKPMVPSLPKSTIFQQRTTTTTTTTTTSEPQSAIVSSVRPKVQPRVGQSSTSAPVQHVGASTASESSSQVNTRIDRPVTKQIPKEMTSNDELFLSNVDQHIPKSADYVNPRTTEVRPLPMGKPATHTSPSTAPAFHASTSNLRDPINIESDPSLPTIEQGPQKTPMPRGDPGDGGVHKIFDTTTQIVGNVHSTDHVHVAKPHLAGSDIERFPAISQLQSEVRGNDQPSNAPESEEALPSTGPNVFKSSTSQVSHKLRPPAALAPKTASVSKEPSVKSSFSKPPRPTNESSSKSTKHSGRGNGAVPIPIQEVPTIGTAHLAADVAKRAKEQQKRGHEPHAKVDHSSSGKHQSQTVDEVSSRRKVTSVSAPAPLPGLKSKAALESGLVPSMSGTLSTGDTVNVFSKITTMPTVNLQNVTNAGTMGVHPPSRGIYGDIPRGPLYISPTVEVDARGSNSDTVEAPDPTAIFPSPRIVHADGPKDHRIGTSTVPGPIANRSEESYTRNAPHAQDFGSIEPAPRRLTGEAPSREGKERACPDEALNPAVRSSGSEGSNSSGSTSKRLPIESPVRDRILQTKRTRVENQENAPPVAGHSRSARRHSGASLASAIVVDDDSDDNGGDDAMTGLVKHRSKGKRKSIDVDERAMGNKRPRTHAADPRRVVSHTIVTSNGFASWGRPPKGPVHRPVAVPMSGPLPGEASRQRALERERRAQERKAREEKEKGKGVPERNKPPETSRKVSDPSSIIFGAKKTIPTPFTFESDVRVEKYQAQFEARLAHWEVRTREASQNHQHQSIPNFAARQAEHLARVEAAREAAKAKVTEPKTPGLKTKIRVKERQVFDEHVREKERIVFKLREMKRIEQEELDRREIGELRKKLDQNVKAKPVPEWYRADNGNDEIQIIE